MSSLSENIKKHMITKAIDLCLVILFFWIIIVGFYIVGNNMVYSIIVAVCSLIVYLLLQKIIEKRLTKWVVPELNVLEKKTKMILNSTYDVALSFIIIFMIYKYFEFDLSLIWVFVVVLVVIQILKWRIYRKESIAEVKLQYENNKEDSKNSP